MLMFVRCYTLIYALPEDIEGKQRSAARHEAGISEYSVAATLRSASVGWP